MLYFREFLDFRIRKKGPTYVWGAVRWLERGHSSIYKHPPLPHSISEGQDWDRPLWAGNRPILILLLDQAAKRTL